MHYCPTCHKPIFDAFSCDSATNLDSYAYCQCLRVSIHIDDYLSAALQSIARQLAPQTAQGQAVMHIFKPCSECGYIVDIPFHTLELCEQLRREPPLQGLPPDDEKPSRTAVPQVFYDAPSDEEVSL